MPSRFAGMDPYLEREIIWHDFQKRFLAAAAAQISAQALPRYIVLIDEPIYLYVADTEDRQPMGRPDLAVSRNLREPVEDPRVTALGLLEASLQVSVPEMDEER